MRNGEKGQALVIVLALVAFGGLVISPFLGHAGSSLIGSRIYGTAISEQYSSDAGVEHAIWDLAYDDLADQIPYPGDSISYQLGEAINGIAANITVVRGSETIASDNFESGGWAGGTGWLDDWNHTGDALVTIWGGPYQGSYHLCLRSNTGYVERAVDLSGLPGARLQFWAKADSFEDGEEASCLISSNGIDWVPVDTWAYGDDDVDGNYHYYDIDLSPYTLSSQFWIAFESNMSSAWDYFYVDDLKIVWDLDAVLIASDNFESGGWAGGTGWLDDWNHIGDALVTTWGGPYEGSYHLRLRDGTGYVERAVDLSGLSTARLQFQAKADSFEYGDSASCLISSNGIDWVTVHTWAYGDDDVDNNYHYYDIDLSPYTLSSEFWIAFDANMSWGRDGMWDYFYVDDLKIRGSAIYGITSVAGGQTIWAVVQVVGETVNVLWWQVI